MEKKVNIIVAAHKSFDNSFLPSCYFPVQVGTLNSKKIDGFQGDSDGDNISDKNPYYCELTGLYWGFKNLKCDISGLVHYRRYFIKKNHWLCKKNILNENDILNYLNKYKIIMPELSYRIIDNPKLYDNKEKDTQDYHLIALENIIKEKYPEYLPSWKKYSYGNKISWGNMFISSKKIFDDYCSWVFPLLSLLEEKFIQENKLTPRIIGFLSELTLCVWVDHNFKKNEILFLQVFNTEIKEKNYIIKNILRKFKLFKFFNGIKFQIYYKKNKY